MKISLASAAGIASVALTLGACSSDKAVRSTARAPSDRSIGMTNAQPPPAPRDTVSNISLAPEIVRACKIADRNAYFAFDSSNLAALDRGPLDDVASCFMRGPLSGRKLQIVGHTDPRGTTEYNIALGQARAEAVADYLISQGVIPANAPATSRGAMDATGHDEIGWALDRRVEISLGK